MKKYFITSPDYLTNDEKVFEKNLRVAISSYLPDFILFRDKRTDRYSDLAQKFVQVCMEFENIRYFIHQDIELAHNLKASGVHLNSTQFDEIIYAKSLGLEVIISTHSLNEVLKAQNLGCNYVTYSPIFKTPNKGEPKGVGDLKSVLDKCNIKIFALGGIIGEHHIKQIKDTKAYGFASIRYFFR